MTDNTVEQAAENLQNLKVERSSDGQFKRNTVRFTVFVHCAPDCAEKSAVSTIEDVEASLCRSDEMKQVPLKNFVEIVEEQSVDGQFERYTVRFMPDMRRSSSELAEITKAIEEMLDKFLMFKFFPTAAPSSSLKRTVNVFKTPAQIERLTQSSGWRGPSVGTVVAVSVEKSKVSARATRLGKAPMQGGAVVGRA